MTARTEGSGRGVRCPLAISAAPNVPLCLSKIFQTLKKNKSEQVPKSSGYQRQPWPVNITFVALAPRWDLSTVTTGTNACGSSFSQFSRLMKFGLLGLLSSLKAKKPKINVQGLDWFSFVQVPPFFGNSKGVKPAYGACCQQWVSQPTASR